MGSRFFILSLFLLNLSLSGLGDNVTITVEGLTAIAKTDDPYVCATLDWWPFTKCNNYTCPWGNTSILTLVTITVKGLATIAKTDDNYVCATLDWWPFTKCNYYTCPWRNTSILTLDVENPILINAVKEFGNLRIRIGGSLQDNVLYNVGESVNNCTHDFTYSPDDLFGYTSGCLSMERWGQVNEFFSKTGALVTFGLNALYGKTKPTQPGDILWTGIWDDSNARDFIGYTVAMGFQIEGWEFGNELCGGGGGAKVDPHDYADDLSALKILVTELYEGSSVQPKISGPSGFFFDRKWFADFLGAMDTNFVDIVSHHIYNLGQCDDPNLVEKMQDPFVLDSTAQTYKDIQLTVQSFAPWASVWVSESGGAENTGGGASRTFVDGFWYTDMLGMASTYGHQVFCRQSLIGAYYGLLDTTTMEPNPDYYSALLFHRFMGRRVLATLHNGPPHLRAYSHCSKITPGITLLLINLSNSTAFNIDVTSGRNRDALQVDALFDPPVGSVGMMGERWEYHLTPKDGDLTSNTVLLNGNPLEVTSSGEIPAMNPAFYNDSNPLSVAPSSIVFVVLTDFNVPACA